MLRSEEGGLPNEPVPAAFSAQQGGRPAKGKTNKCRQEAAEAPTGASVDGCSGGQATGASADRLVDSQAGAELGKGDTAEHGPDNEQQEDEAVATSVASSGAQLEPAVGNEAPTGANAHDCGSGDERGTNAAADQQTHSVAAAVDDDRSNASAGIGHSSAAERGNPAAAREGEEQAHPKHEGLHTQGQAKHARDQVGFKNI